MGKLTDDVKDELNYAIENDSSSRLEFTIKGCTIKIDFKQSDNVFNLYVECIG